MYEYKDKDIVSLNVNFRDLVPSSEDITQDELRLITSDANRDLTPEELNGLKKRFKKIHYTILDMEQNRKGFGLTEDAMKTFVDHFNATKEDKDLHNLFKDHDYTHIDSLMGRITDTRYDAKNKRVRRTALVDLRHPTAKRLDMFQNLSTTILHGRPVCSECSAEWLTCTHNDAFPRSTVAYGMEDSLVTQSAYANAKRDSLSMFKDSLSNIDISKDFFGRIEEELQEDSLQEEEDETEKRLKEEAAKLEKEKLEKEKKEQEEIKKAELKAKEEQDIKEIKENIEFLKKVIEKDLI